MIFHRILVGDALDRLAGLPDESVHAVVTSPPYWGLRDYGAGERQLGLEPTPAEYIARMVQVFREVRRVLRSDGTLWLNMGDSYAGSWGSQGREYDVAATTMHQRQVMAAVRRKMGTGSIPAGTNYKPKDLIGMPWRFAFALQDDGWYLRQDIIWSKRNPMPESVRDRCTKAHEYIFLLSKSEEYFFDAEAIKEKASQNTHSRGGGVNPKATREGQHSRMCVDRDPRHAQKLAPRSRQNASFSAAVRAVVSHRKKRSVWHMATAPFREAHFATYPLALPTECIKAATSEKGVCASCGRPLARIVAPYDTGLTQKSPEGWDTEAGAHGCIHRGGRGGGGGGLTVIGYRTIGWESCCPLFGAAAVPPVVLDPFSGAGTTGVAALPLGRSYIGIELNPDYVEMSLRRIRADRPADHSVCAPPTPTQGETLCQQEVTL